MTITVHLGRKATQQKQTNKQTNKSNDNFMQFMNQWAAKETNVHTKTTTCDCPKYLNTDQIIIRLAKVLIVKLRLFFLSISKNLCLGTQRNRLNETVLLSIHNIRFG